jgi:uncharacterized membrane protein SpoIIM required for sporulation
MALTSSVTEAAFAARRQAEWTELDQLTRKGLRKLTAWEVSRIPILYRDVCADLARAQAARYSAPLVDYLQGLTAAAHTLVYGTHVKGRLFAGVTRSRLREAFEAFPRTVRKHWVAQVIAFVLFFGPFFAGLLLTMKDPQFAYRIVPESMLRPLAEAYAKGFDAGQDAGHGPLMAGFYVNNNVGIALRCFALGIFFGVGSAFYLVYNGLATGAILGYVVSQGAGGNILTFIVGHGSLELGAIVIAGGAGLSMGWSIIAPGDLTRAASLQKVGREIVVLVFGAAIMLFMAAGVEAFWSGSSVPTVVKRAVGITLFVLILGYILVVGRRKKTEKTEAPWT